MELKVPYILIAITSLLCACEANYIDYHSKITPDKGEFNYVLYLDGVGIGDPGYTVVRLEKNIIPEDLYISWTPSDGINYKVNHEQIEWFRERTILFNYAEAGFHTSNPKIEFVSGRYVVLSRGGYYYGLYDVMLDKDTFNIGSPWNEWRDKSGYQSERYDRDKEEKLYEEWIKRNIHSKIKDYMKNNK